MISPLSLLKDLTAFPHRGVGSNYEKQAADFIHSTLEKTGFEVSEQQFLTPKTYVPIVWQYLGGLIAGLLLISFIGWGAISWIAIIVYDALMYFDWRPNMAISNAGLINRVKSQNIIGNTISEKPKPAKIVLMAHYDTAPVSTLYKKQTADGFRNSIRISMLIMALCVPLALLIHFFPENQIFSWAKYGFILYFLAQGLLGTIGYFKQGFVNGASDNATGVVAAIATAERLKNQLTNCDIELVLTSAEEAGMIGAYYYWKKHFNKNTPSYLINFDTLGAGNLKFITQTGSWTTITYESVIKQTAEKLVATDTRFSNVAAGKWHTADFDSAWFARDAIPCITLAALDKNGLMPRIHRHEDIFDNVETAPMLQSIDFAEAICLAIDKQVE